MTGKSHVAVSIAVTGICIVSGNVLYKIGMYPNFMWCGGLVIGSLLPDIDNKRSILGKYVHLNIKHRTWTHSIWAVIGLFLIANLQSYFILKSFLQGMLFGYVCHLIMDKFSRAGVCLFYPFTNYIYYDNGAFIAKNHKLKLYRTGGISEYVFTGIFYVVLFLLIYFKSGV